MKAKRTKGDLNDILFENRNKNYGAYALRKSEDNSILIGLLISLTAVILMAGAPKFFSNFFGAGPNETQMDTTKVVFLTTIIDDIQKPKTKVIDPPLKPNTQSPKGNSVAFKPSDSLDTQNDSTFLALNNPKKGDPKGIDSIPEGPLKIGNVGGDKPKGPILTPDKSPEFPGGYDALMTFLKSNIKYPQRAIDDKVTGTAYISFVVDETGKVKDVKGMNKVGLGCDEEAMRVIKMMPDWTPGVYQNENVAVLYNVPVKFKIK